MERYTQLAQVKAPTDGASKAEDFQPPTRNPQSVGGSVQSGGSSTQSAGGQELLGDPTATISVTRDPIEGDGATTAVSPDGVNWVFVLVASAVIVAAAEYWFRRRDRKAAASAGKATASSVEVTTDEPAPVSETVVAQPAQTESGKKKSKKKSKSKRKHK